MAIWFPAGVEKQRKGDTVFYDPRSEWEVLHIGSTGQALVVASGRPSWGYPAGLTIASAAQGDILYYNGTAWVRLPAGTAGQALITGGSGANPAWGPGAWSTYTPTVTAGIGTFTTVSATGHYLQMGKILYWQLEIAITTNGTAAGNVITALPGTLATTVAMPLSGRATAVSGKSLNGVTNGNNVQIWNYDNTYPGGTGEHINVAGVFEVT